MGSRKNNNKNNFLTQNHTSTQDESMKKKTFRNTKTMNLSTTMGKKRRKVSTRKKKHFLI